MVVDDNLKDCTEEYVNNLQKQLKKVTFKFKWTFIVKILFLLVIIVLYTKIKNIDKDNKILREQLYKDEVELTLEHSIGYWFINTPEAVNDSLLYNFLTENDAWYPDILLRQAKIESGNYTSNVYKNTNNLYGMRKVGKRQTTQRDTYKGYGVYDNWCLSVLDRMLWDIFYFKNEKPTKEEYLKAMSIYAEDSNYIFKIK